ncbi:universal stress protein [Pollutimonas sp. M17]|uniref:universal stress protein n=1 Tax=Pollutimonas sp. M17 TaxID=2962065 RepID=UPI0021F474BC|nr:universal stress protein [Pollutimonas sp. M17]UYO95281.1 universal stress protein [Pollutimonas sp. M17]
MLGRIAIHLGHDEGLPRRLRAALQLATEHKAELIGIYPPETVPHYYSETSPIPEEMQKLADSRFEQARVSVQKTFLEQTGTAGVRAQWRAPKGSAEEVLALHARYCDLLVMSKAGHRDSAASLAPNLAEAVIMAAGKPVLMIPAVGEVNPIGRRVLFCWDHRREAARAFSDAAPLLHACSRLTVLTVDPHPDYLAGKDLHENDFADYCAALGYPKPREIFKQSEDYGVGNIILNTATDEDSDLIVMGAYGHSRMRQWIMGGASRTLLNSMTVPVLMSH